MIGMIIIFSKANFIHINEFIDAIPISFSQSLNCYTIRFNCHNCTLGDTKDACLHMN